jgi:hypothetical protein
MQQLRLSRVEPEPRPHALLITADSMIGDSDLLHNAQS